MDTKTIIRAWKDPEYRAHLSSEQRAALPENPSGKSVLELGEEALGEVVGGEVALTVTRDIFELGPVQIRLLTKQTTPLVTDVPVTAAHHVCI
jgi:mersacidin/lichenicidin family type 2 lantibiotic